MPPRAGFYHQQPVWQDLQGPATGINPPGAASDPTVEKDLALLPGSQLFSGSVENILVRSVQLYHGHIGKLHTHIHYQRVSAGAGAIDWQMRHRIVGDVGGTMEAWSDWTALTEVVAAQAPDVHLLAAYQMLDVSTLEDSEILWLQLRRMPGGYTGAARLLYWDDHVQLIAAGSEAEFPGVS